MTLVGSRLLTNIIMEVRLYIASGIYEWDLLIANNSIQHAAVKYILDTVVEELGKNKDRKFIYVEIAFFTRWWNEQNDDIKQKVLLFHTFECVLWYMCLIVHGTFAFYFVCLYV